MLDVTLDLITQTASSTLFAFCFCNLIIVIILAGLKPGSEFQQEERRATPPLAVSTSSTNRTTPPLAVSTTSTNEKEVVEDSKDKYCEDKAVCDDNNDVDDGDDDDDDELRKRVEEFIEKVNRGWKAELSKTPQLV